MSDFDKEAEREKLRQQYETDKEERKSTQRMSELLLQGATMTGKHCDTCGDPIFRYDGNEFCSTCQQAESEAANAESNGSEPTTETAGQDASEIEIESTEPDRPQQNQAQQPSQSQQSNQAGSRPSHPTPQQTPPHQSRRAPPSQAGENETPNSHGSPSHERPRGRTTGPVTSPRRETRWSGN